MTIYKLSKRHFSRFWMKDTNHMGTFCHDSWFSIQYIDVFRDSFWVKLSIFWGIPISAISWASRPSPAICLGKHRMIPEIEGSFQVSSKYWKDHSWLRFSPSHSSRTVPPDFLLLRVTRYGSIWQNQLHQFLVSLGLSPFWSQLLPIDLDPCMVDACRCVGSLFEDIPSNSVIGFRKLLLKTSGFPTKIVGSCKLPPNSKWFRVQISNVHHPSDPTIG